MTIKVYNELLGINHVLAGKIKTFELKSMFCNIFFFVNHLTRYMVTKQRKNYFTLT